MGSGGGEREEEGVIVWNVCGRDVTKIKQVQSSVDGRSKLGQFEPAFSHFQPILSDTANPVHYPAIIPTNNPSSFSAIDPTSSLCTLNQQQNSILKSSQTFSRVW